MAIPKNRTARRELDRKLTSIPRAHLTPPRNGWVRTIRQALGMSAADLAARMGVTGSAVQDLERAEPDGRVTLDRLNRAAEAMDCDLVYALIPRTSLTNTVERQARARVAQQIAATARSMSLEAQDTDIHPDVVEEEVQALIDTRKLWKQSKTVAPLTTKVPERK
ncbi:MAG: mobile mystery protein A [Actinomycetota bacterium]|nr:mobile mystery protein A [Actinomycetota bacterium]